MSYIKQNFVSGQTLKADHLNYIEDGIMNACKSHDWNATEGESGHILNRTHYEDVTVVNEPLNLTWDGNIAGLTCANDIFFKVSDIVPTNEQIKTATVSALEGGTVYISDIWDMLVSEGLVTDSAVSIAAFNKLAVVIIREACAVFGRVFNEPGIYFVSYGDWHITSFITTEPVEYTKTVLKKLDKKYLPNDVMTLYVNDNSSSYVFKDAALTTKVTKGELLSALNTLKSRIVVIQEDGFESDVCVPQSWYEQGMACFCYITKGGDRTPLECYSAEYEPK